MDIHTPSVASTSSAVNGVSGPPSTRSEVLSLITKRDAVEAELKALGSVLDSHGVTMDTPLTRDGFPRDDIDIAQVRATRARIIYLRNDYKALMMQIEEGLHAIHAASPGVEENEERREGPAQAQATQTPLPTTAATSAASAAEEVSAAFAKVNSVAEGSPAGTAGLEVGDYIIAFGSVNALNNERLSKVAQVVQEGEGRELEVRIRRKEGGTDVSKMLKLTPRSGWGGRGLLGCHLLPL